MLLRSAPDILILGQITLDHVVPAEPGAWHERLGGNALYAAAGARLWCDPARIGIVARRGPNLPAGLSALLAAAGLTDAGLAPTSNDNLVEWLIYETDGSRRSLPRAPHLRDASAARYIAAKRDMSASHLDIPEGWLPAAAIHLAPQVGDLHSIAATALAAEAKLLSVDPSPIYSRRMDVEGLAAFLRGATILMPSQTEIDHLAPECDWGRLAAALQRESGAEIAIKLGAAGVVLCTDAGESVAIPAAPAQPVDLTGAGDAFCGAYLACRAQGLGPADAARRGVVAAAMVIECAGVEAALGLSQSQALERLTTTFQPGELA